MGRRGFNELTKTSYLAFLGTKQTPAAITNGVFGPIAVAATGYAPCPTGCRLRT